MMNENFDTVKVKALEWSDRRIINIKGVNWAWDAKTPIDWYVVATASGEGCKGSYYWFVAGDIIKGWANSEQEAKDAVDADYRGRILSCIEPAATSGLVDDAQVEAALKAWFHPITPPEGKDYRTGMRAALAAKSDLPRTLRPLSTYPESRSQLLALCVKLEKSCDDETAIELADYVRAILDDEAVAASGIGGQRGGVQK